MVVIANGFTGRYPPAGTAIPDNGLHLARVLRPAINTQFQADLEAREIYERNRYGSLTVTTGDSSLRQNSDIEVRDLIPGRRFRIESPDGCRPDLVAVGELTQVVADFETRAEEGRLVIAETRVAVDIGPVGARVDVGTLSA